MEIVVCIKQVPDTTEVKIDPKTNTLMRQGVPSIVNPFDKNAIEAALALRDKHGGKVTVITMGPPQAQEALREALAMGADEAVLLSDRAFGGADTLATSFTLASAVRKIGKVDLILCGKQAIDGDTAQVGPEMAEHLGIPQLTYVRKIDIDGDTIKVERVQDDGYEVLEAKLPVLVTVVKEINEPRYPTVKGTMKAQRKPIPVWTADDLGVDKGKVGLNGSPTQVQRIFTPERRGQGEILEGSPNEVVQQLVDKLRELKIV